MLTPLTAEDPTAVAGYRITHRLGEGGMGKVYLSHTPGGRPVAIKVVRPELAADPDFRRRFRQEVRAAERVQGLYTAPVIDSDTEGERPWLATAYVAGPSLYSAVRDHGPLPVPAAARALAGIAEALQIIHGAGIVHRDLKPSNVLLASDGPRVIDFGIARAADATSLTRSGAIVGTPGFMAPEQAMNQPSTPAVDLFALGQIAVFATTGTPAFGEGASHGVLYRIVHEEPDLSGVPEALRDLTARCLAKNPAGRASLAEVIETCQRLAADSPLPSGGWLPPAVTAEIDHHAATVTSLAVPPPMPTPPPGQPDVPTPPPGQPPAFILTPTGPPAAVTPPPRRSGRTALLAAVGVCVAIAGVVVGAMLMNGGGDGDGDKNAGGEVSQDPTTEEPATEAPATQDDTAPDGTGTQEPTTEPEPPADPEAVVTEGLDLPADRIIWFYDDPPTPKETDLGVTYEGDFGFSSDWITDNPLATGQEGNTMVLLEAGETGSLDTCRSVTRYTDAIPADSAPPGSQICVTTATGDIALVTVQEYAPEGSPSLYVTIDLTVWPGAAQLG
ncbi:serine/threonine-protein kinase [Streptomyces litchfieldiae]|uniref:Serine/threonine-protein kinase n=1 Tax=Streptomyces litchfieldiae TaxID=3075543 RepID=A0ABU2MUA9_9ACTN|nr:serine/threonine-protein kinase [Streptomyces sp. DSM 44938]MDT0345135.1 serine/threonine-protein kinase [Streptomyces sp. DSM 44938]